MATATVDKRGLKRICMSCSTRFYDFNKRPIVCPNCDTEFTGDVKIKIRRARANDDTDILPKDTAVEEMEIIKDDDMEESDTVSLDELDEDSDEVDEDEVDPDLELDEDDDDEDDDDDDEEDDEEDE